MSKSSRKPHKVELRDSATDELICIYETVESAGIDMFLDPSYLRKILKQRGTYVTRGSKFTLV